MVLQLYPCVEPSCYERPTDACALQLLGQGTIVHSMWNMQEEAAAADTVTYIHLKEQKLNTFILPSPAGS